MALKSLRYRPSSDIQPGDKAPIFSGKPHEFYEWEWRTTIYAGSVEKGKEHKMLHEITKSLSGDALQTAMDFSVDALVANGGVQKLIDAMREMVFPNKKAEAKELYRAGHKQHGILSRQSGETMLSYISRRKRWWKLLKQMDDSVTISDDVLGDLLLDNAMLSEDQKRMVLTVTDGETSFEEVAKVLMDQHNEQTRRDPPKQDKFGQKPKWKRGYVAYEDYESNDIMSSFDDSAFQAMVADHAEEDEDDEEDWDEEEVFDIDEKTAIELDTVTAFWAESDASTSVPSDSDPDLDQQISDAAQTQVVACFAWGRASKGKGKGKGKGQSFFRPSQGKGKGRGKGKKGYFVRKNGVSLEERKRALKALKARTNCQACGQKGHWAGDPECRAGKSSVTVANLAVASTSHGCSHCNDESCIETGFQANSSDSDDVAFMAAREADDWDMLDMNESLLYSDRWHENFHAPDLLTANDPFTFVPTAPTLEQLSSSAASSSAASSSGYADRSKSEESSRSSKKKIKEEQPLTPKCETCVEFTSKGSNAYIKKLTCRVCGHWTKSKVKQELTKEIEDCDHKNYNNLGLLKRSRFSTAWTAD